ncbi:MAG TPA: hypothetical protein P5278_00185 [Patescibacteria group bacterium]|nr:hypothetical protein [Patescibacteria group bacterium]
MVSIANGSIMIQDTINSTPSPREGLRALTGSAVRKYQEEMHVSSDESKRTKIE